MRQRLVLKLWHLIWAASATFGRESSVRLRVNYFFNKRKKINVIFFRDICTLVVRASYVSSRWHVVFVAPGVLELLNSRASVFIACAPLRAVIRRDIHAARVLLTSLCQNCSALRGVSADEIFRGCVPPESAGVGRVWLEEAVYSRQSTSAWKHSVLLDTERHVEHETCTLSVTTRTSVRKVFPASSFAGLAP